MATTDERSSLQPEGSDLTTTFQAGSSQPGDLFATGWNIDAAQLTLRTADLAQAPVRKVETAAQSREDEHGAPWDRLAWFLEPRAYPGAEMPDNAVLNAYAQSLALPSTMPLALRDLQQLASPSRWQLIGPGNFAGRVNAIAVDPNNTQRIYACCSSGGVWRSTNGGSTWTDINQGLGSNFTSAVAVDPNNSNVIYLCTGDHDTGLQGAGLYRSTNMGNSWVLTGLTTIRWASRIIVHPTNSQVVYAATNQGVYKSVNAGVDWTNVRSGNCTDLVMNPSAPDTLYCGVRGTGIYKTTNGGTSWTLLSGKPSDAFTRVRLALCDNFPATLYASYDVAGKVQIWKSSNSGASWANLPDPPDAGWGQLWYNHYIAVKPNNPNVVYSGQGTIFRSTNGGAGGGVGAGKAWQEINQALHASYTTIHVDHHCLTFDPVNPNTIYCGCDGGVYRSRWGGNYWEYIGASIPSSEFYAIGQGVQEHYQIGGGTQDNGTWLTDGAYSRWRHILGGDGFYFVVDPTNPNILYAEWQNLNLNRSDNKGQSFAYKSGGIMEADPKPWMGRIELDQRQPATLYVGSDRIYKTTNRMDNWTLLACGDNVVLISQLKGKDSLIRIHTNSTAAAVLGLTGEAKGANDANDNPSTYARMLSTQRAPFALTDGMTLRIKVDSSAYRTVTFRTADFADIGAATAKEVAQVIAGAVANLHAGASAGNTFSAIRVAPSNSNVVYAAALNQLWRSTNGGRDWRLISKAPLPNRWITDIDISPTSYNQLYVTVSGFGTPHVFYTANGGSTWQERSNGLPDTPVSTIVLDPSTPARLWVGADTGVYRSLDGGLNWTLYNEGIPRVVITDLKFHRNTGLLRAGTYGRGVWERQATDPSVQITGARTASNGSADREVFRLNQDALALTLDIAATQDLLNLGLRFDAVFQILDSRTNQVVRQAWYSNSAFQWGRFFWISQGNNWGPNASDYTTPAKWGLQRGIYYFRGAILVRDTNAFAVSPNRWFRVI